MTFNACLQGVINAAKDVIPEKEMKEFINQTKKRLNKTISPKDGVIWEQHVQQLMNEFSERAEALVKNKEYNAKLNVLKQSKVERYVSRFKNSGEGLYKFLVTDKNSVLNQSLTWIQQLNGMLESKLTKAEFTTLKEGKADLAIAEHARYNNSTDSTIKKITQVLNEIGAHTRKLLNAQGAMIGERQGRLYAQAHNQAQLDKLDGTPGEQMNRLLRFFNIKKRGMTPNERYELAFGRWNNFVRSRMDLKECYLEGSSEEEITKWLQAFYDNVRSNIHRPIEESAPSTFTGAGIMNRLNSERKLIFKDPKSEVEYAKEYGHGSIINNVLRNYERAAKDLALLQNFGSNPTKMYEGLRQKYLVESKTNEDALNTLRGRKLQTAWELSSGQYRLAIDNGVATLQANIRAIESMAKFAKSNVAAFFLDPLGRAAFLKDARGLNWGESLFRAYSETWQYVGVDRPTIKNYTYAFSRHTMGHIQNRFGMDSAPGKVISKLQDFTFKVNGLQALDRARMEGVTLAESNFLGNNIHKEFTDFTPQMQTTLKMFGIEHDDWNVLRKGAFKTDGHGKYLLPDSIGQIKDEELKEYAQSIGKSVWSARNDLQFKLSNYLRDAAGYIVMDAQDPTMQVIRNYMGQAGTLGGEFVRHSLLGKSWGVQYTYRIIKPLLQNYNWSNRIMNAAVMFTIPTILGYGMMVAKNSMAGMTMPDWQQKETWLNAAKEGGGLGIYSDILFRYLQDPSSLLPIAATDAYKALKIPTDMMTAQDSEKAQRARGEFYKWMTGNLPIVNLPYVRMFLDHAVLYQMQNAIDPGSVARLQYSHQKNGDQYFWAPTSALS